MLQRGLERQEDRAREEQNKLVSFVSRRHHKKNTLQPSRSRRYCDLLCFEVRVYLPHLPPKKCCVLTAVLLRNYVDVHVTKQQLRKVAIKITKIKNQPAHGLILFLFMPVVTENCKMLKWLFFFWGGGRSQAVVIDVLNILHRDPYSDMPTEVT